MLEVDACIEAFLKDFRRQSGLGTRLEGAFYWNEREVQWELFRHLRERAIPHRIGSEWWFHAEGTVEKPAWARWGARRRGDIVMINHAQFKGWSLGQRRLQPGYEAMMELKLVWSGEGKATTIRKVRDDLKKLSRCLGAGLTKEGHMILIDGLDRNATPYYSSKTIRRMLESLPLRPRLAPKLHLWHWPDSDQPVSDVKRQPWHHYTAYV